MRYMREPADAIADRVDVRQVSHFDEASQTWVFEVHVRVLRKNRELLAQGVYHSWDEALAAAPALMPDRGAHVQHTDPIASCFHPGCDSRAQIAARVLRVRSVDGTVRPVQSDTRRLYCAQHANRGERNLDMELITPGDSMRGMALAHFTVPHDERRRASA